jgi:hypothetical protein
MTYPESIFYLIREMGGLGLRAKEEYFDAALEHIREHGISGCRLEVLPVGPWGRRRARETIPML